MSAVHRQHLNSLASYIEEKDKAMIEFMRDSFYVDNCITSVKSDEDTMQF